MVLSSLSRYVDQLSPLKFLITGRPERNFTSAFGTRHLGSATQHLVLHKVPLYVVQPDIEHYFANEIAMIGDYYRLDSSK